MSTHIGDLLPILRGLGNGRSFCRKCINVRAVIGRQGARSEVFLATAFIARASLEMRCVSVGVVAFVLFGRGLAHQTQTNDYNRDVLAPLTKYRQQHRRTVDGRLCAAAFVQNRKAYTGCTDATNPVGESGRPWCYVEPQVGV